MCHRLAPIADHVVSIPAISSRPQVPRTVFVGERLTVDGRVDHVGDQVVSGLHRSGRDELVEVVIDRVLVGELLTGAAGRLHDPVDELAEHVAVPLGERPTGQR